MFSRIGGTVAGLVMLIYGIIAGLSPLPAGAPLAVVGMLMIAAANPAARPIIVSLRRRWPWFNRLVRIIGRRAPSAVSKVALETAPENAPDERQDGGAP